MLEKVKWEKFKLGDLFDIENWEYGKNKKYMTILSKPTNKSISVISGITENNGINFYTEDTVEKNEIFENELTISTRGEYSGTVFYHNEKFVLANNILVMKMPNLFKNQKLFIGSLINSFPYGGYNNYPKKSTLQEDFIELPIKNDGSIDFEFMTSFISELEARQISELETYLVTTGLSDYVLNCEEKKILEIFRKDEIEWKEFKIVDLFKVKNSGNILSRDIVLNSGKIPYLSASRENNAVSSYISYDKKYLDKGNCIFIGGKTFVVTYQKNNFYSNDSHNLALYFKDENQKTKLKQLFFVSCIEKSLSNKYSWGNSISNKKIQNDTLKLPIINGKIDFEFMEILISAIQKIIIKDVVLYSSKKIEATKKLVFK